MLYDIIIYMELYFDLILLSYNNEILIIFLDFLSIIALINIFEKV